MAMACRPAVLAARVRPPGVRPLDGVRRPGSARPGSARRTVSGGPFTTFLALSPVLVSNYGFCPDMRHGKW
jgi:hypothetical protein